MQRREFLRSAAAAVALPALGPLGGLGDLGGLRKPARIGIQLYTLRDDAKQNLERTLAAIAKIGYREVELLDSMDNFGMAPAKLRKVLDGLHLRAPSTHIDGTALDDMPRLLDRAATLGHQYVVLASLPEEDSRTADGYKKWADKLNTAGAVARKSNMWVAFHDEATDFKQQFDGRPAYDIMLERTDPKVVRLQLDTGNALVGGVDPLPYLKQHHDRYYLFHVKDAAKLGAEHDTELGTGILDLKALLAAIGPLDGKHLYVEQESYPGTPLESARRDFQAFSSALKA
jgi:sugar phosphate isomerase/epimerase